MTDAVSSNALASGSVWRRKGATTTAETWQLVSIDAPSGTVGLTGPGPCRSMLYLTPEELEEEYEVVSMG